LPDRALDLIDDAGARVKLRRETEPRELAEIRNRVRLIIRQMENAIANHEFEKARFYSEEERKECGNEQRLIEELKLSPPDNTVAAEDLVEAVAARAGVPVSAVRSVLELKDAGQLELIAKELAARIPGPALDRQPRRLPGRLCGGGSRKAGGGHPVSEGQIPEESRNRRPVISEIHPCVIAVPLTRNIDEDREEARFGLTFLPRTLSGIKKSCI
jgi:hypothetical protein